MARLVRLVEVVQVNQIVKVVSLDEMLSENIWFTWSKPSYYSIFGKEKSVDGVEKKSIEKEMQKTKKVSRCWWVGGGGTPNRTSGQTSRPPPVTSHSPNKF